VLIDEAVEIEGVKIYGSPVQPEFHAWAFNKQRGPEIKKYWDAIPEDTEILISHGPAAGILDVVCYADGTPKERVGCHDLYDRVMNLKYLKHHIFGHIHSGYGYVEHNGKHFWNASICDEGYMPSNDPHIIEL
jgi:Icc-related predicted phosphoesterase